ncbi:phytanoyl-CoA dioxygenase family protein [Streptosporangium sandarakinum]|uniref:phytanoyl-CoA dioxygenase family protein n=1 Tax=Streptosporangium sandarakinum TaxID=1260955 RepID=UPI003449DC16
MERAARVLSSNAVPVPFTGELFRPLPDSTALLGDPEALRRRFREHGVLLLRGVLDPAAVVALREAYLSTVPPEMLHAGSSPAEGRFSGKEPEGLPGHGVAGHPAHAFVRSPRFAEFVDQPALSKLAETLLDGPCVRLRRSILRHFHRGSPRASRAHTDYAYMDRGTENLLTVWIPVGDCPLDNGPLVYLEDSHTAAPEQLDRLRERLDRPGDRRPLSHDLEWTARGLGRRWLWADYRAGDVAVHGPHIVHASLDTSSERMRVSVDIRFARSGETVDARWTKEWAGDDGA